MFKIPWGMRSAPSPAHEGDIGVFAMIEFLKDLVLLVVGFVLLIKGADIFVDGASGLAKRFGVPEIIIGLTIVAMGTSAPETAVSIAAAAKGNADISIGNVLGSNIMNILVILGVACTITAIAVGKSTIRYEMPFLTAVTVIFMVLGLDGVVSRLDGVILWVLFIAYLAYMIIMAKRSGPQEEGDQEKKPFWKIALFIILGMGMIVVGSNFSVDGASGIARIFGMSERFIGLTIVALGTSLPELVTSCMAARKGNADIAIGNIVGSNIFNILFVIGTASLIVPINFAVNFRFDAAVAIGAAVILLLCALKGKLKRVHGIIMLLCYAAYFAYITF